MNYLLLFLVFIFGTSLGSFVLVVADRYNTGKSALRGRSICFNCNTTLKVIDLVPFFSFIFLGARCRYCSSKLSYYYFVVEVLMGALSVAALYKSGFILYSLSLNSVLVFFYIILVSAIFLFITIYDLRHFIIPDRALIILGVLAVAKMFYVAVFIPYLIAGVLLPLPFLILWLVSRGRWMGFGDIKYMLVLGLFLGVSQGTSAITLAFWIGAGLSLSLMFVEFLKHRYTNSLRQTPKRFTMKTAIPFGPFLSLGTFLVFCFGIEFRLLNEIINEIFPLVKIF